VFGHGDRPRSSVTPIVLPGPKHRPEHRRCLKNHPSELLIEQGQGDGGAEERVLESLQCQRQQEQTAPDEQAPSPLQSPLAGTRLLLTPRHGADGKKRWELLYYRSTPTFVRQRICPDSVGLV